jgi:alanine-glyoxylate transaminase/serine-glyoxylate transaminase/serine-pyruvate transaminase
MAYGDLKVQSRVLMGPGPSDVDPRVLKAMTLPVVGHLDPGFLTTMDEVQELLRHVFQTENELTLTVPGTGMAGMEAALTNLLEPGDRVVVGINGFFGGRLAEIAARCGAQVVKVEVPWGEIIPPGAIEEALAGEPTKLVALVHAETSTGVLQPLEEISQVVHRHGALLLVDMVTSLGGTEVRLDDWGVDVAYSGSQKCLGCPPGLAPVSFGPRAVEAMERRQGPPPNWYLDLSLIGKYWSQERFYHHTAPISLVYAMREALRLVYEEGLAQRFDRHRAISQQLQEGLEELGLELFAPAHLRAPMLTTVKIPEGVEDAQVRSRLLQEYGVEIGGGLGQLKGKIWRIGLMGYSCQTRNVTLLLAALKEILREA